MDEDEIFNFLCESVIKLIDDHSPEDWRSHLCRILDNGHIYVHFPFQELLLHEGRYKDIEIDYVRQLIRRQGHNFLREYANVMLSAMITETPPNKETFVCASLISFFVVELIYKCTNADLIEENDPIFLRGVNLPEAVLNILTDTNLPFKYLETVFHLTENERNSFFNVVARFMEKELCLGPIHVDCNYSHEEEKHLLVFLHKMWVTSSEFGRTMFEKTGKRTGRQRVIQNALELQRAGIRFKGVKRPTFDIRFRRGLLEIPVLSIVTETCSLLQIFIYFEEKSPGNAMLVVTDYCVVMDCLIQSPQDVQLLRESGVIESYLHDDKEVVTLFNNVGKRVPSSTHFCYADLFDEVNKHCDQTWNSWKAKFRLNYFRDDNQLEAASFMFAIYIILPVTVLQAVYTVLSYYKGGG